MLNTPTTETPDFRLTFDKLTAAGVVGFCTRFEATEVVGFPPSGKPPINVFSIFAAEETEGELPPRRYLTPTGPISVASFPGWKFGVVRYYLTPQTLATALANVATGTPWQPSGDPLDTGPLRHVPVQFVPRDSFQQVPWNRVLKNNFFGGSHVLEWVSVDAERLKVFRARPMRLRQLAEALRKLLPIRLDGLSDRLGSIVVQLPVTVVLAGVARTGDRGLECELAWHPRANPRPLRISSDFYFDRVVTGFASVAATSGTFALPARSERGTHRVFVWDDENGILLAASGESVFNNTIAINLQSRDPEPRVFSSHDPDGALTERRIAVLAPALKSLIGSSESDDTAGATRRRIYREEAERLNAERRFVQYMPQNGDAAAERAKGLDDLKRLINWHGQNGAWLWDPFVTADDVLETLFYCKFGGADLRALTAAQTHSENDASKTEFVVRERAVMEARKGNCHGLRLEFRARVGNPGWAFHDRFLIFPRADEGAVAWSLGTSVNSFGKVHHILQRVDDGQLIADAFSELWAQLGQPEQLIWKTP